MLLLRSSQEHVQQRALALGSLSDLGYELLWDRWHSGANIDNFARRQRWSSWQHSALQKAWRTPRPLVVPTSASLRRPEPHSRASPPARCTLLGATFCEALVFSSYARLPVPCGHRSGEVMLHHVHLRAVGTCDVV